MALLRWGGTVAAQTIALFASVASGHGNVQWPPTWFDAGGTLGMEAGQQCGRDGISHCQWFTNDTHITAAPQRRVVPPPAACDDAERILQGSTCLPNVFTQMFARLPHRSENLHQPSGQVNVESYHRTTTAVTRIPMRSASSCACTSDPRRDCGLSSDLFVDVEARP